MQMGFRFLGVIDEQSWIKMRIQQFIYVRTQRTDR